MHWRTPFPPRRPSLLAELIGVFRASFSPERAMTPDPAEFLPDELPPAETAPLPEGNKIEGTVNFTVS